MLTLVTTLALFDFDTVDRVFDDVLDKKHRTHSNCEVVMESGGRIGRIN